MGQMIHNYHGDGFGLEAYRQPKRWRKQGRDSRYPRDIRR